MIVVISWEWSSLSLGKWLLLSSLSGEWWWRCMVMNHAPRWWGNPFFTTGLSQPQTTWSRRVVVVIIVEESVVVGGGGGDNATVTSTEFLCSHLWFSFFPFFSTGLSQPQTTWSRRCCCCRRHRGIGCRRWRWGQCDDDVDGVSLLSPVVFLLQQRETDALLVQTVDKNHSGMVPLSVFII